MDSRYRGAAWYDLEADGSIPMNCFTLVVGAKASATGCVLVAQNEDDAGNIVVRHGLVGAKDWPEGTVLPHEEGLAAVPQAEHTAGFFWRELRTQERGLSNADGFYNEHGVLLVSNSCAKSRCDVEDASLVRDGGVAYLMRRITAERAASARDAVRIMMELADTWGYAPSGRSYTVADSREAFMIQFARGRQYIGARIPDDMVAVMPNHYLFHGLHEWPEMFYSRDVVRFAIEQGWYVPTVPGNDSDFDFARAYQAPESYMTPSNVPRGRHAIRMLTGCDWQDEGRGMPFAVKPSEPVDLGTLRHVLSTHFEGTQDDALRFGPDGGPHDTPLRRICTSTTQEALLADLREDPKRTTLYLALGRPCVLPFFRVHPFLGLPEALQPMESPHKALERHLEEDDTATLPGADPALLESRKLQTLLEPMYRTCSLKARQAADDLFAQALSENSAWAEDQPSLHDVLERDNALADRIVRYMRLFRKNELEKSEIRTVAGLGEPQADGNVTVTFTVPGTVSASDLLFGVATRNMRQTFASVLPGTLLWEEGVWKAAFSRDDLKETLPASGEHLFCLCGRTSQGPFAALWTETMGAKATAEAE